MECTEIRELLSAYYDGELPESLRIDVESHLNQCKACAKELAGFRELSALAAGMSPPEVPGNIWESVSSNLGQSELSPATGATNVADSERVSARGRWRTVKYAAALVATLLVAFVGFEMWYHAGDHDHHEMAVAIEQVVAQIDSAAATTFLLDKFGGSNVPANAVVTEVGYEPVASGGLPEGYTVENYQILEMPCCTCVQTACKRADGSRVFIFEHDEEDTGWFEERESRSTECCGKSCQLVEIEGTLAVTWQKGDRHITLLGVQDEAEMELLVTRLESEI